MTLASALAQTVVVLAIFGFLSAIMFGVCTDRFWLRFYGAILTVCILATFGLWIAAIWVQVA